MTWKSTAAASGLMVVATWVASYAPVGHPRSESPAPPSHATTENAAAQIQREADRLHLRLQHVAGYKLPARNPFRFATRAATTPVHAPPVAPPPEVVPVIEPQPPALRVRLTGISEAGAGDEMIRTAIISTPDDVHMVKVGETVGNVYKVTRIDANAVELVRIEDGTAVTLSLRP